MGFLDETVQLLLYTSVLWCIKLCGLFFIVFKSQRSWKKPHCRTFCFSLHIKTGGMNISRLMYVYMHRQIRHGRANERSENHTASCSLLYGLYWRKQEQPCAAVWHFDRPPCTFSVPEDDNCWKPALVFKTVCCRLPAIPIITLIK
ncbi:uncharacterized protein LOC105174149 [Sesamum indicum]|uniref:Uncharacterized protein LOC105174149 n=1 Tax=Sesamum indicum TaxID=4182 RepID=A0A6I9U5J2_SESIN|nr:uncharacterized protein LOC105174149 [Sesamum indicum]